MRCCGLSVTCGAAKNASRRVEQYQRCFVQSGIGHYFVGSCFKRFWCSRKLQPMSTEDTLIVGLSGVLLCLCVSFFGLGHIRYVWFSSRGNGTIMISCPATNVSSFLYRR
jgi:hypothetical protein